MGTVELRFERSIRASAERVYDLLADLRGYDRWLPRSAAFHGTTRISEGPVRVGTTYVETSPAGTRRGIVTSMSRPVRLDFEQPMTLRPRLLGRIGIELSHVLTPGEGGVYVLRRLQLAPNGLVGLLMPRVIKAFRAENERMLDMLAAAAERGG